MVRAVREPLGLHGAFPVVDDVRIPFHLVDENMRLLGVLLLLSLYAFCCHVRWRHARHYEERFRLMRLRDFIEGWDYARMSRWPRLYKLLFVVWLLAALAIGTL